VLGAPPANDRADAGTAREARTKYNRTSKFESVTDYESALIKALRRNTPMR